MLVEVRYFNYGSLKVTNELFAKAKTVIWHFES